MAWIYFQGLVESALPLALGCGQSPIASATDIHKASYCLGCDQVTLTAHPSGTTCKRFEPSTCQKLISSTADFPAKTLALQEMERVWKEADQGYFSKSSDSLATFDLVSFSWKTSQLSLFGGLTEFSWSSLRWGTIVDGRLYQPRRWEPHTSENEFGYLPTPTASEYGPNQGLGPGAKVRPSLSSMARHIPTPKATDGSKSGTVMRDGTPTLQKMARRLPTPAARDGKDGWTPGQHGRNSPSVAVAVAAAGHRGFLNPQFVEVLMGLPIGWTALKDLETQWYLKQRAKRSFVSQELGINP